MSKIKYWIENNCQCGISDKTGKWSEKLFEEFGCNCREEISDDSGIQENLS